MESLPGFLSASQSACVKGKSPEKVLESWALAASTALLMLSAFLSICKDFSQGQTFQRFAVFYFYFISCLLNGLWHHALCPALACQWQSQSTGLSQTWEALALGIEVVSGNSSRGMCALVQASPSPQPPSCQNDGRLQ